MWAAMESLDGKVAIVTGAGRLRGIGRAAAVALAERGADVVVTGTGRDPDTYPDDEKAQGWRDIESTADQVRAHGRRALALQADVTRAGEVERAANQVAAEFGRIDILVNNAALARAGDRVAITELSEELWRKVLDVKLTGSFLMCRAVLPAMIGRGEGGSIVNVSSVAAKRSSQHMAAYSAANAGMLGFTRAMAVDLAPHKIRVNAVCPGLTDTARMDSLGRGDTWKEWLERIPLGRAASDEEVGGLIAWLCAAEGSYITGQSINIDGGIFMD